MVQVSGHTPAPALPPVGPTRPRSEAEPPGEHRVGWILISMYAAAYVGTCLVLIAPLVVTLALKVDTVVGSDQAATSLALVTGIGALAAMLGNPFFGS
jgi:hypothetical protein